MAWIISRSLQISPAARRADHGRPGRQHPGPGRRRAELPGRQARDRAGPGRRGAELFRLPRVRSRPLRRTGRQFLPVGFYYKTFHEKRSSWKFWEPIVRKMAGLGKIDPPPITAITTSNISSPMSRWSAAARPDVAAAVAGRRGGRRGDADRENSETRRLPQLCAFRRERRGGLAKAESCRRSVARRNIRVMTDAVCTGLFADNWIPIVQAVACTSCAPRRWSWRPVRSSSRRCSATTICRASCWARRRSG